MREKIGESSSYKGMGFIFQVGMQRRQVEVGLVPGNAVQGMAWRDRSAGMHASGCNASGFNASGCKSVCPVMQKRKTSFW